MEKEAELRVVTAIVAGNEGSVMTAILVMVMMMVVVLVTIRMLFVIMVNVILLMDTVVVMRSVCSFHFYIYLFVFYTGFLWWPWRSWNSLCRPGCPGMQRSTCLCFLRAGI